MFRHGLPLLLAHGISRVYLEKHLPEPGRASNPGQKFMKPVSLGGKFISDFEEMGPKEESRRKHGEVQEEAQEYECRLERVTPS